MQAAWKINGTDGSKPENPGREAKKIWRRLENILRCEHRAKCGNRKAEADCQGVQSAEEWI